MNAGATVDLSLISHTNAGKTTLARTLLGRDVGEVRDAPHVTAEGTVLMDVNVQKREPQLAFAVAGATNAPISTKEAQTRVIVRDGGTTVIGGIYKVSTDQGQDRVPGLANIPVLGHLFKNRRREDSNEELLIFITPRVIKL